MNHPRPVPTRLCLFGAAGDTGNLGVSALMHSVIAAVDRQGGPMSLCVMDHGRGLRTRDPSAGGGSITFAGLARTRRLHRAEAQHRVEFAVRMGGLRNPTAREIVTADALLDASGGDSFSDLYGADRFATVVMPKLLAAKIGTPLHLLPQTYGPFADAGHRRTAEGIVRRSATAWARDADSFAALRELAGPAFDPHRHRQGVDMAFGMDPVEPDLPPDLRAFLDRPGPVAGFNLSGLLLNDPDAAGRYGLVYEYERVMRSAIDGVLDDGGRVLLVPHVIGASGQIDADPAATVRLAESLGRSPDEVRVAPSYDDPRNVKGLIARLDWFCGTRMHATIAALSSGVPTAAVAYSIKTRGVFESCGQGHRVVTTDTPTTDAIDLLLAAWADRDRTAAELATGQRPETVRAARAQLDELLDEIVAADRTGPRA
jgi:polysaccharide pyruvyl transferase WcaK-like protein